MSIDNTARVAPSLFNDDETLEVCRIITRGSGSKYMVNGKTVRAKDVQLLFADASTGANSPALVRQNQISELISAKPENRRKILEEAAGISGLHTRRHEAELRLRAAETNLERMDDILAQIESQLLSLRRQSRQAARFKRIAGEIREYRTLLWLKRWDAALATLANNETALKQAEKTVAELTSEVTRLTTEVSEISTRLEPHREEQIIAAAVCGRLNAAREALENDAQAAQSEISKLEARLQFLKDDIEREEGIITDADEALERLGAELAPLQAAKDQTGALNTAAQKAEDAIKARNALDAKVAELRAKLASGAAREEAARREVDRLMARKTTLEGDLEKAEQALQELETAAKATQVDNLFAAALETAAKALSTAKSAEQDALSARERAETKERDRHQHLTEKRRALSDMQAEYKALEKLGSAHTEQNWTPVLELVTAKAGYERALAAALGDDLDAGLEDNLPLNWQEADVPTTVLPDGARPLSDYVEAPKELRARLCQIGVVGLTDGPKLAKNLKAGQKLVSKAGDVWRWDGFRASSEVKSAAAIRLENKNRMAELAADMTHLRGAVEQAEAEWTQAKKARQAAEEQARALRADLPTLEAEERQARKSLTNFETDMARRSEQKNALTGQITRFKDELSALQNALKEARQQVDTAKTDARLQADTEKLEAELQDLRSRADAASAQYLSLKNETQARAERLANVEKEITDWTARAAHARERMTSLHGREAETAMALQAAHDSPDEFTRRKQKLLSELSEAETRQKKASDALAEIENALREADGKLKEAERNLGTAREERAACEARFVAARERKAEITARIAENLSCAPDDLKGMLENLSPESGLSEADIERKLERLTRERENLGSVNLRADEEAAEQEAQLVAMQEEREDLIKAIAKLREGIDSLNDEGRTRLLAAFDTVNGHFGRLFTTLFGGGHASLALTESEDPLEAGLEILVSPPGKRLGNMSLMSGGEQALTATALIFAVFLSNPAPICVLDEVDAPLDDANVERYCNLLDEMVQSTKTKFIAITHNPVTMARMDRLFGVTMAEQGVSQLVSIDLGTAEKLSA